MNTYIYSLGIPKDKIQLEINFVYCTDYNIYSITPIIIMIVTLDYYLSSIILFR